MTRPTHQRPTGGTNRAHGTNRAELPAPAPTRDRRQFLRYGLAGLASVAVVAAAGAAGFELINDGMLPGKSELDQFDGACDVPAVNLTSYATPGPQQDGTFYSAARQRTVGYSIGYPPGHGPGDRLPLVVALHGFGGNHANALVGMSPAQAAALKVGGTPLPPLALVTVDGGNGYWNPHPGDNPQAMLVRELIPLCQRKGLGTGHKKIGVLGISMGGYGALLLAEKYPHLIGAVAAISPAIWTTYAEANSANRGAYASAQAFTQNDAITHAQALAGIPVRVASGNSDPFHPGVQVLAKALPEESAETYFSNGCHTGPFFTAQEPPSLAFLARHLIG